jgi:crotonobetainyl-CoA:carnitine CoA-transferase CaiB-like acyl-CoA transferase
VHAEGTLTGLKVLQLCRAVAGPTISKALAEYGAEVLKVLPPNLADVGILRVDGNAGQLSCFIDLKSDECKRQ